MPLGRRGWALLVPLSVVNHLALLEGRRLEAMMFRGAVTRWMGWGGTGALVTRLQS
jgi:hypothetical protein